MTGEAGSHGTAPSPARPPVPSRRLTPQQTVFKIALNQMEIRLIFSPITESTAYFSCTASVRGDIPGRNTLIGDILAAR